MFLGYTEITYYPVRAQVIFRFNAFFDHQDYNQISLNRSVSIAKQQIFINNKETEN